MCSGFGSRSQPGTLALQIAALLGTVVALMTAGPAFPTRASWSLSLLAGVFDGAYFFTLTVSRGGAPRLVWPLSIAMLAEPVRSLAPHRRDSAWFAELTHRLRAALCATRDFTALPYGMRAAARS